MYWVTMVDARLRTWKSAAAPSKVHILSVALTFKACVLVDARCVFLVILAIFVGPLKAYVSLGSFKVLITGSSIALASEAKALNSLLLSGQIVQWRGARRFPQQISGH